MLILTAEEGRVRYLHYGVFETGSESLAEAQERSTELLLARLPPPPARVLDVGIGLGTTLSLLLARGYEATGISPDQHQIAMAARLPVQHAAFETFQSVSSFDVIVFQESSQYIDSEALFTRAAMLAPRVVVLDEFALRPLETPGLHSRDAFVAAANRHGFTVVEEVDLSAKAAPTMNYFTDRIPAFRSRLIAELGLTDPQVDDLVSSGATYRQRYVDGTYGYRLFVLER